MASFNLIFCNRNDGYPAGQSERINLFIDHYASLQREGFDLHLTIVDWNPPEDQPLLQDAFPWSKLLNVDHVVVTKEEHRRRFPKGRRPINDYTGRNMGLDRGRADFNVILNQDIFIAREVFEEVSEFGAHGDFYFRSDRLDIPESVLRGGEMFTLPVIKKHDRLLVFPLKYLLDGDRIRFFEKTQKGHIVQRFRYTNPFFRLMVKALLAVANRFLSPVNRLSILDFLFLHMNASGDFLVLPKFFDHRALTVRYPETEDFYMHTDGYILIEMQKVGMRQVILNPRCEVRHIDHYRPDRSSDVHYDVHKLKYIEMLGSNLEVVQNV